MRKINVLAPLMAVLLLAGCGSSGLGDILGGGSGSSSIAEIRGTVDHVDTSSRSIILTNVTAYDSRLANGGSTGGTTTRIYYESNTPVEYQGQNYRPEDLERGDQIAVRVDDTGSRLVATSMTVLRDSSTGYGTGSGTYGSTLRGTVSYVDSSRRILEVDRGFGGGMTTVQYDTNTYVEFNGRRYRVEDLDRGDEIEINLTDSGGRLFANSIMVVRDAGGSQGSSSAYRTMRGTVSYVDTSRRLIELSQASWTSGFNSGSALGNTIVVQYDNGTEVEFQGRLYAPTNLERGDIIDVQVTGSQTPYFAERINVVRSIR